MKKIALNFKALVFSCACVALMTTVSSCDPDDAPTPPVVTDPATVTDIDGNVYTTVRIGTQLWTVENLRTTRYNDGSTIATGLDNAAWEATITGAFSVYEDAASNNTTYGKLYNWYAVNTGKLAPAGWHVPTREEWQTLTAYLGQDGGGKMKSTSSLWEAPNLGATNSSGFTALPSGYRGMSGNYALINKSAYFWGANQRNATQGNYLRLDNDLAGAAINGATKQFGYAVRLVKD